METFNYAYSWPYMALFLFLVVLMFWEFRQLKNEKETNFIRWAVIIVFVFFFGLRGFVYTDWVLYYPMFDKLPTIWDGGLTKVLSIDFSEEFLTDVSVGKAGLELGFVYFAVFFKSIINDYFAFVFLNTVIDIILLNIFIRRYSKYYVLSFIIFLIFWGMMLEINLLRNFKALLFFMLSLKYLQERRMIPYMLLNLAGFFFHSSAFIFLPLYFILNKQWPPWLIWTIFIVGNIIFLLQIKYLQSVTLSMADLLGGRMAVKIRLYFASDFYSQAYGLGLGYVERILTFLGVVLFQKKLKEQNPSNQIFINCFLLYFIIYFYFAEIMVAVQRLSLLFVFAYWILYPEFLFLINKTFNKWILLMVFLGYGTVKIFQSNANIFSKYDNLLFGIESFEERKLIIYNNEDLILKQE